MSRFRLAHKIFFAVALVVAGLLGSLYLALSSWISVRTHDRIRDGLIRTRSVLEEFLESRTQRLAIICSSVAEAPRFKAAISEEDPETVQDHALAEQDVVRCDLMMVTGSRAQHLAWIGPRVEDPSSLSHPLLDRAHEGEVGSGLWLVSDRLFQIAVRPVRFGPEIAGVLLIGYEIDERQAREIQGMTATDVMYLFPGPAGGPSTMDLVRTRDAMDAVLPRIGPGGDGVGGGDIHDVRLAGARHLVLFHPLDMGRDMGKGWVLLLENLDAALEGLRKVQIGLLVSGAGALLVALLITLVLVNTITTPISTLVRGTQEVGRGNYDFAIEAQTSDEIGVLAERFDEMRVNLKAYIEQMKEAERVKRDLELARNIQSSLLPDAAPELEGAQLAGSCTPAHEVGGDYYDYVPTEGGIGMVIVDVSGHNVGSALMMAMSRSVILTVASATPQPDQVLTRTNRLMFDDLVNASLFFSAFYAHYDTATRRLTYANAGHNPPILVRADGSTEPLQADGMLCGLIDDAEFALETRELNPDDIVVLYTDGIVESTDTTEQMYGDERFLDSIQRHRTESAESLRKHILEDLSEFTRGMEPFDDITLVVLKVDAWADLGV